MFKLEECAAAVAVAIVGTIRTGDDATRFAQRAQAEGFNNISELIANDSVKQALALQRALASVDPKFLSTTVTSVTHSVGELSTTTTTIDTPFEGKDETVPIAEAQASPAEVFASTAAVPAPNDIPLQPANSVEVPDATTLTSTTTATVTSAELDKEGLPWDARIHSSSRATIKDGTWKLKRGLESDYVEEVKAELKKVMNIPAEPAATTPPPPAVNAFSVATVNKLVEAGNGGSAIPAPPAASEGIPTLAQLMRAITTKKLEPQFVKDVLAQFDIPGLPVLGARQDLIPAVAEALGL